jgi:hypothetical protein
MTIKFISENTREARLANRRVLLARDESCSAPDKYMDTLFHPGHGEVHGFSVMSSDRNHFETFTCSSEALQKEFDAMNFKSEEDKDKWLDGIKDSEKKMWQAYFDGEVYGIFIEEWNNEERRFRTVDALWGIYGLDDMKANIADIVGNYDIDCFVVDNELGDPENWKDDYREFDVVDFS